jgi:hypothetical protein
VGAGLLAAGALEPPHAINAQHNAAMPEALTRPCTGLVIRNLRLLNVVAGSAWMHSPALNERMRFELANGNAGGNFRLFR